MKSLEWINAEIIKWQEILNDFKKQLIEVKGTRNEQTTLNHIEFYELKLKYLHKIKSELELKEFSAEESMRLFYVAVTRAKKKLYITAPLKVKAFNKEVEQEPSIVFENLF